MKWTKEQNDAINKSGTNIIVSAGAGSGKTAVLTERVVNKLKNKTKISELLVLTFTNNAAEEMKERIKKEISNTTELSEELNYIESADITTFDAFVLSLVNKYYYLLGVEKDINIVDESIISYKKKIIIDEIFDKEYQNEEFRIFATTFGIKNDKEIKNLILNLNNKCDLIPKKEEFLKEYTNNFYKTDNVDSLFSEYENLIKNKLASISFSLNEIEKETDSDYFNLLYSSLKPLIESNDYKNIKNNINIKTPNLPRGSSDLAKYHKANIKKITDDIASLVNDDKKTLIKELLDTKDTVNIIIKILMNLNFKLNQFKEKHNLYEFNDIIKLAIKLLENNNSIRYELKNKYKEIMIDEYQDTSDIQEYFISLIENNNVYMVGDIKQSIYKFRNANIDIFKNKYDLYKDNISGVKIDLNKNFRSRKEVIEGVNTFFKHIMDDYLGNANYALEHLMVSGNLNYEENSDYNVNILNYKLNKEFSQDENEAFIIGRDILKKIKEKFLIFKNGELTPCSFEDFTILIDRTTNFGIYNKVFNYLKIPLNMLSDENILHNDETYLIKNIIDFIFKIKNNDYNYKFNYVSIARSYLYELSDEEIYLTVTKKEIKKTEIYKICKKISLNIENMSNTELIEKITQEFDFYTNMIKVGDLINRCSILDNILNQVKSLNTVGITASKINDFFDSLIEDKIAIKRTLPSIESSSVTLTNIHKSKGLQYRICYYPGLSKSFNLSDSFDKFILDKQRFIVPYFKSYYKNTFLYDLYKEKYIKEEISERLRLFYVSLTRCQEKMILLTNIDENKVIFESMNGIVNYLTRMNYRSFQDILISIYPNIMKYISNINPPHIDLNYKIEETLSKKVPYTEELININKLNIKKEIMESKSFSKKENKLLSPLDREFIEKGNYLHYILENIDFKNPDYTSLTSEDKNLIESFLKSDLLSSIDKAKIYKEFEFINIDETIKETGIIDLLLEFEDHFKIIDYKLKNISDEAYINQLKGYKKYIETKYNKKTEIYLYSLIDKKYKKIS